MKLLFLYNLGVHLFITGTNASIDLIVTWKRKQLPPGKTLSPLAIAQETN